MCGSKQKNAGHRVKCMRIWFQEKYCQALSAASPDIVCIS